MTAKTQESSQTSSRIEKQRPPQEGSNTAVESLRQCSIHYIAEPAQDIFAMLRDYSKDRPDIAAVWCFGLGVIVGWKMRR